MYLGIFQKRVLVVDAAARLFAYPLSNVLRFVPRLVNAEYGRVDDAANAALGKVFAPVLKVHPRRTKVPIYSPFLLIKYLTKTRRRRQNSILFFSSLFRAPVSIQTT